jgi:hypothetical protein
MVHHEAIPEFVDRKGERSGMDSMTMPFEVAEEVPLAGVAPGDKVEMTFEVRWKDASLRVVRLTELPADADLRLGGGDRAATADPPAPAPSPGAAGDGATAGDAAVAGEAAPTASPAATGHH